MLNIPEYRNYSGETKIALMDNSTVAFLEQGGYLQRNYLLDMRLSDHGDRFGGLLSGYVGLIIVPVAYN